MTKRIVLQAGEFKSDVVKRQAEAALKGYRVYVDLPRFHGWTLMGKEVKSCRMFTDGPLAMLHAMAGKLGLRYEEFQGTGRIPRYDISEGSRRGAILLGAKNLQTEEEEQVAYAKARR